MQFACVLRTGPEYKPKHVYALADSLLEHHPGARVLCLTDARLKHPVVESVRLWHRWPGWFSKMELFRPGLLEGPTLYLDLDTVVLGKIEIGTDGFTMLPDVYREGGYGSGAMAWNDPPVHLYREFSRRANSYIHSYRTPERHGDQGFIRDFIGMKPKTFGSQFRSYKAHCRRGVPKGTKVVYFHGKPRPWQVELKCPQYL